MCEICAWECDEDDPFGVRHADGLRAGQRHFLLCGVFSEFFVGLGRAPRPEETRKPGFETLDDLCAREIPALSRVIAEAFAIVPAPVDTLSVGMLADSWVYEDEAAAEARRDDGYNRWQDIPEPLLADTPEAWSYLTPEDWVSHLPARMMLFLKYCVLSSSSEGRRQLPARTNDVVWGMFRQLQKVFDPSNRHLGPAARLFSPEQQQTVERFLSFAAQSGDAFGGQCWKDAQAALELCQRRKGDSLGFGAE